VKNHYWSKYFTPLEVAVELLNLLPPGYKPCCAIDICMGQGNFLKACRQKWANIQLKGTDIDCYKSKDINDIEMFQLDALNVSLLKTTLKIPVHGSNLIVANPPFGRSKLEVSNNAINSKLYHVALKLNRIEAVMMMSNLRIMKNGDYFGAILPENFFSSIKFHEFRYLFLNNFENVSISNAHKVFKGSEVTTRYFVGRYRGCIINADEQNSLKAKKHKNRSEFSLYRGVDNSKLHDMITLDTKYEEVLHFSNRKGEILKRKYVQSDTINSNLKIEDGDTIILRVGRNSGLVFDAKREYKNLVISDYFYILKNRRLDSVKRKALQNLLLSQVLGVTTKYITKMHLEESLKIVMN